jgi:phosphoserine aminotransferase
MNLLRGKASADYVNTGEWSKKAIKEAKKYGKVNVVASSEAGRTSPMPAAGDLEARPGCRLRALSQQRDHRRRGIPLDARDRRRAAGGRHVVSNILSRPIDVSKYGLIYAGAQKNIGPAGLTIVIVRDDLIGQALPGTPDAFDYKPGRQRLHVQHAAHLRDLHRRPGVPVDQGAGRPGRDGRHNRKKAAAAVRLPRRPPASTATRWPRVAAR